jgi:hypothetical protein
MVWKVIFEINVLRLFWVIGPPVLAEIQSAFVEFDPSRMGRDWVR